MLGPAIHEGGTKGFENPRTAVGKKRAGSSHIGQLRKKVRRRVAIVSREETCNGKRKQKKGQTQWAEEV